MSIEGKRGTNKWKVSTNEICVQYSGVKSKYFIPSISRKRPASIYYEFILRPDSKCTVSFKFTRAFMKWVNQFSLTTVILPFLVRMSEYPSDANHGKYIPPAVVHVIDPDHSSNFGIQKERFFDWKWERIDKWVNSSSPLLSIFSSPLLLTLPVPDFSMPFNVEAFVCVVISLCFSPILELSAYMWVYPLYDVISWPTVLQYASRWWGQTSNIEGKEDLPWFPLHNHGFECICRDESSLSCTNHEIWKGCSQDCI